MLLLRNGEYEMGRIRLVVLDLANSRGKHLGVYVDTEYAGAIEFSPDGTVLAAAPAEPAVTGGKLAEEGPATEDY